MVSDRSVPTTVNFVVEFEEDLPPIVFGDGEERKIQKVLECIQPLDVAVVFHKGGARVEVVNSVTRLILLLDDGKKVLATLNILDNEWGDISYLQDPPTGFAQQLEQRQESAVDGKSVLGHEV